MPLQVAVEIPPEDGILVTEDILAMEVHQEFDKLRYSGVPRTLGCSVSVVRLQHFLQQRYPIAYEYVIRGPFWGGKWHRFLEAKVGLCCFFYKVCDYVSAKGLEAHIPPNELRCRRKGETASSVRQADSEVGLLLWGRLLRRDAMHHWCYAVAMAAIADNGVVNTRPPWRKPLAVPFLTEYLRQISCRATIGSSKDRLRRHAIRDIADVLLEEDTIARHISLSRLCRSVGQCVGTWGPETFATKWDQQHPLPEILG
ncbi:hypothetical protein DQ04_22591000 [Trypanosoma grayi]|uniref:hypothetical protein n=1 Tax=Trypanosoma grayi TaxID=71804 RepID=UPI0004F49B00|nr:hypothetical protein DQ04_22591000 [Trypanosoma grayi]KEG05386.1 hypothetical protein DQ04_22591000 [Trypanosoma grayi]